MVIKISKLREKLGILDNELWKQIREDAGEIFKACECHLQCGIKSQAWTSVNDADQTSAVAKVKFPFNVDC